MITTISTCLIVKNESSCIERCIKSIQSFSDEIIIYDTGSNDGTQEICSKLDKVKVIQGEWRDDFAWARNESFKYATCDYIMWVDADDIIDEKSQKWLLKFKENELFKYSQINIEYIYDMSENEEYSLHFYRERIIKKDINPVWVGRIHEYISVQDANIYNIPFNDMVIKHYKHEQNPYRNLNIYKIMEKNCEISSGRDWFYYARECEWLESDDSAIEKYMKAVNSDDIWRIDKLNSYIHLSEISYRRQDLCNAFKFAYLAASCTEIPRADVCCLLGDYYYYLNNLQWAKKWYENAVDNVFEDIDNTFMGKDKSNIYPCLQLCVIEYSLGNIKESSKYNDKVLEYEPNNLIALGNKVFFSQK